MIKKTFSVSGMHCSSCAMTIEWDLEDHGIKAKCSYANQVVEVEYEPEKISDQDIKQIVAKSGYKISDQSEPS